MALLGDGTPDVSGWLNNTFDRRTPAGLFQTDDASKSVALKSRHVSATLHCTTAFAEVQEELSYVADQDVSVTFKFPTPPRAAVYKCEAVIGDRVVRTQTKRKKQAVAEFNLAVQQGHTAVLAKQDVEGLLCIEVGNLEAHTEAIVRLSYLQKLDRVAGALEFVHTATWVPPYLNAHDMEDGGLKAADVDPKFASQVHYTLTYDVQINSDAGITEVVSASHGDGLTISSDDGPNHRRVSITEAASDPSKDFSLLVETSTQGCSLPSRLALQEATRPAGKKLVAQATFVPMLGFEPAAAPREVWFVVDGSGSMGGQPEVQARDATSFFVKDLPCGRGIRFNVVVFGSKWTFLYRAPREFTEATAKEAEAWIQRTCNANHGGTEILGTLQAIYDIPIATGHSREIIFLTDGGVSGHEEERIKSLITSSTPRRTLLAKLTGRTMAPPPPTDAPSASDASGTHIFCLGIGHGVHRGLLDAMSALTGGTAQYVVDGEDVARKAGYLKKCALSAGALRSPKVVGQNCLLRLAPAALPALLFPGEPITLLAEVVQRQPGAAITLEASASSRPGSSSADAQKLSWRLPLDEVEVQPGDAFAVLHAMCYIGSLLDGSSALHVKPDGTSRPKPPSSEEVIDEVVRVAVEENLTTPHTAAVGVLLQADPLDPDKVQSQEVALQVPHGRALWGGTSAQSSSLDMCMQSAPLFRGGGGATRLSGFNAPPGAPPPQILRMAAAAPRKSAGLFGSLSFGGGGGGMKAARCRSVAPCPAAPPPPSPCPTSAASAAFKAPGGALAPADEAHAAGQDPASLSDGAAAMEVDQECEIAEPGAARMNGGQHVATEEAKRKVPAPLDDRAVLRELNGLRSTKGCWSSTPHLLQLLASRNPAASEGSLAGARPEGVSGEQWATVLVVAFLRTRLVAERAVWEGMEAKALAWLQSGWAAPTGLGVTVIKAMKHV